MQHAILPVLRPQSPTICSCRPPTIHRHTPWRHLIFSGPEHVQPWLKKSPKQMVAFSQVLIRGGRRWEKGGGIERGGEDLRTRGQGRGGLRCLSFGKEGRLWQGGSGGWFWKLHTSTCMSPPIIPPANLVSGWTELFGPLERSCLPPFPPKPSRVPNAHWPQTIPKRS